LSAEDLYIGGWNKRSAAPLVAITFGRFSEFNRGDAWKALLERAIEEGIVMSVAWILLVAVTGAAPSDTNRPTAASSTAPAAKQASADRSARELRHAVADALRRANAKRADYPATVAELVELFKELGKDQRLTPQERQRLGVEVRSRLLRFVTQFQHEIGRDTQRADSQVGAAAGAASDDLNRLVDLIQNTVGPQDWVLAQRIGGPAGAGQAGGGVGAQAGGGTNSGSALDQQAAANGQALVELIQDTIAPNSWDLRGGPGSIVYFNPLRCLVVRQTGEGHDALSDLLGAARR
jgi:hypothetical protein